ncbi:hypothetical protein [Xanthomonas sacchari]|uniref:hypothetical protein n=1 Tax=Xanthomonas sacchari TaxID=56458 RepID=UPI00224C7C43|nr:hypothetical protein [Xanthomonas sacchari]
MRSPDQLRTEGFTESGAKRYTAAVGEYCNELYKKAVALGDVDKAPNLDREVTHDHVRTAAAMLAIRSQGSSGVQIACQIGEYVCAALAGVGGGKLEHTWGVLIFGLSLTLGVILFVIRNQRSRAK